MLVDASIDIKLAKMQNCKITSVEIIKRLLKFGWTLNDNGKVSYLPLGDCFLLRDYISTLINLGANRKVLDNVDITKITDVNWYLAIST